MVEQIGKFQLLKPLGKGASGTVYLALDTFSGAQVALKVLSPELVASPSFDRTITTLFMNEASLAGKLVHPHIASILEASVQEDSGYIAIEYVPGGDLSRYTSPGKLLSPEEAIQLAFKSCGALDYAFRQGIVHRDIKPANIMVVEGTNIKVGDFGAALLKQAKGGQPAEIGSPYYMSPEQIKGEELDHHSDMFSMGVVLYELFTGRRPFTADKLEALFAKILTEEPAPPSALRPEVGREVDRIVMQMIRKERAERFPTWADAALEVARVGRLSVYHRGIADSEKFSALKKVALLSSLGDAEIWELVHAGKWNRLPAHQAVVREGEAGESLFFLAQGGVKVTKQGRLLNVLNAGECFGEMAYIKRGKVARQATVESMDDTVIAEFNADALHRTSANCQLRLADALLHSLVDRLTLANDRMAHLV